MNIRRHIPLTTSELFAGFLLFLLCLVTVTGSRLSRLADTSSITAPEAVHIYLERPTSLEQLSEMFADSGIVESREEMIWAGRLLGWNRFNTGHYLIDGNYSYDVLLSKMARGIQDPIAVTVLPGQHKASLITELAEQFQFDSTALAKTLTDTAFLDTNGLNRTTWIGRMLPNTYSMYWNASPESVVRRIFREFEKSIVERYSPRFREIGRGVDEIVTLASIIEWEVRHQPEKETVSGLYWNRLERGMRLQADPTVNYALGERRRLLYEDYQFEHPYNTYIHRGLPPGPITNPSKSSIEAALFPAEHDYLYMVATPEGYHLFSETFEEHRQKSEKWREWLREQYQIKRERERRQQTEDTR
ncbi:MAG: endolytic transglycosylase MltG [Balneolaceae bacterium]|nr:endolytic transglycosylase MltG [Balneolaceae bacterium]